MVEGAGLENQRLFTGSVGSNPTPSALYKKAPIAGAFLYRLREVGFEPVGGRGRRNAPVEKLGFSRHRTPIVYFTSFNNDDFVTRTGLKAKQFAFNGSMSDLIFNDP